MNTEKPIDPFIMRPMTISDLVQKLQALPQDLELWTDAGMYASHDRTGVQEVPLYFNLWPDESPCWEFTEATSPGRCIRVKMVAILIDNDGDVIGA